MKGWEGLCLEGKWRMKKWEVGFGGRICCCGGGIKILLCKKGGVGFGKGRGKVGECVDIWSCGFLKVKKKRWW